MESAVKQVKQKSNLPFCLLCDYISSKIAYKEKTNMIKCKRGIGIVTFGYVIDKNL